MDNQNKQLHPDLVAALQSCRTEQDSSDKQLHRLFQVLHEYFFYTPDFQLDLAEAAIRWGFAALASHDRRAECKSCFYACADMMYVATDEAEKTLSESDLQQIEIAATANTKRLAPGLGDIWRASGKILRTYPKDDVLRVTAELLHQVLVGEYLEHVSLLLLRDLICRCLIMCTEINAKEQGVGTDFFVEAITNVSTTALQIVNSVCDAIESGELVVRDGVIVSGSAS